MDHVSRLLHLAIKTSDSKIELLYMKIIALVVYQVPLSTFGDEWLLACLLSLMTFIQAQSPDQKSLIATALGICLMDLLNIMASRNIEIVDIILRILVCFLVKCPKNKLYFADYTLKNVNSMSNLLDSFQGMNLPVYTYFF